MSWNTLQAWAIVLLPCLPSTILAQEWTRFRGPNGTGISQATTVPARWSENDYNWKVGLPGVGHSSPVLWGERLFVTCGDEQTGARMVVCMSAKTGEQLWARSFSADQHTKHKLNSFASSTPVVDAGNVYLCWGSPKEIVLMAISHDGQPQWRRNLGPFRAGHGFGVSPILHNDLLVLPNHHQADSFWLAVEKQTGKTRWRVSRDSKLHYSTPCVFRGPAGRDELIFTDWEHGICGVEPSTGAINWQFDVFDKEHVEASIASPVVAGDLVIGVCGYLGYGYEVVAVRPGGDRQMVWRIARGAPLCPTPVVMDNLLFLWSDGGIVSCADVKTGSLHWQKRVGGSYYSSPVWVGGKLYNTSKDGECVVLAATRNYQLLARNDLGEPSHATAAIAGGVMYLRTFSHLISIGGDQTHSVRAVAD